MRKMILILKEDKLYGRRVSLFMDGDLQLVKYGQGTK